MWKSTEYCTFDLNWNSSHDPSYIVSYSTVQDNGHDNWVSAVPDLLSSSESLHCHTTEGKSGPPELRCACKPHNSISILGVDVISGARILEVYSDLDGYLKSVKGEPYAGKNTESAQNCIELYNCRITLDEPLNSITLKFLGLTEKLSFMIYRLHYALVQRSGNMSGKNGVGIDLDKVKRYLQSMGDVIPENARGLLNSVEQYQHTQMMGIPTLQRAFAGLGTQAGQQGDRSGLTALLSMFSKLPSNHPPGQEVHDNMNPRNSVKGSNSPVNCSSALKSDHHFQDANQEMVEKQNEGSEKTEKLPREVGLMCDNENVLSPLEQLLRKPLTLKGQEVEGHDTGDRDEMYQMLQGICGSVSALRLKSHQDEAKDSEEQQTSLKETIYNPEELGQPTSKSDLTIDFHDICKTVEQTVTQEIKESEQRMKEYIDTSLAAMETRLSTKLDQVLELLSKDLKETIYNPEELGQPTSKSDLTIDFHDICKTVEQTVTQEIKESEQRMKEYIDTSLAAMETRLSTKLDQVLELLSKESACDT